jgi:hypothetical protein
MLKLSTQQTNRWEARLALEVVVLPLLKFLHRGMDRFTSSIPVYLLTQSNMR